MSRQVTGEETLRLHVLVADAAVGERVTAEVWSLGAGGVEEQEAEEGTRLIVYALRSSEEAIRDAIEGFSGEGVQLGPVEVVGAEDWSEAWKDGLEAIVISDRLVVRPSFVPFTARPGQETLLIDPGQAFGTGGHVSTRLLLEWLDALGDLPGASVLDVGTGSGVLGLAALKLGARTALGFDLDPVAVSEAGLVAEQNGLAERFERFTGGIDALATPQTFDVVVANLLRNEVLPIAPAVAARVRPGGQLLLSGLLASDAGPVVERFAALGLAFVGDREMRDGNGDRWVAPRMRRPD